MNTRTKHTQIDQATRKIVNQRDKHCIFCGMGTHLQVMHYIPRSKGGLGIEENLALGCLWCHQKLDQSTMRNYMLEWFSRYLTSYYPDFPDDLRVYKKGS